MSLKPMYLNLGELLIGLNPKKTLAGAAAGLRNRLAQEPKFALEIGKPQVLPRRVGEEGAQ